jgi:DNA-binding CsgD family transcriptional regulator
MFAGRLGPGVRDAARAAGHAPKAPQPARPVDLLLDGLTIRFTDGYAAAVGPLTEALNAYADADLSTGDARWLWLACRVAQDLFDDERWHHLATRGVRLARESGALSLLPSVATYRAALDVHAGAFSSADGLIDEADTITRATSLAPFKYAGMMLAALRGDEAATTQWFESARREAETRGEGLGLGVLNWATAVLHNGGGRYADALHAAQRACEDADTGLLSGACSELVEAAVRAGEPDIAAAALDQLAERACASRTDWALGAEAAARGLVTNSDAAYREAIAKLSRTRGVVPLARARLTYGEWLRRENRRVEAREVLRAAHETLSHIGARAYAERARRELVATGETAPRLTADTRDALTPQEAQVARMARDGHTNSEIGAQLFISPRTVEYHLRKVFRKLDVSTRRQLRDALA